MRPNGITLALILALTVVVMLPLTATATSPIRLASATLIDTSGTVVGFAKFVELTDGRILVNIHAQGLAPGEHGIHVHAVGACTLGVTPPFSSAGGHFNPTGTTHGSHAGDLGNITANPAGRANMTLISDRFTLSAGMVSLFDADGSALVIHAGMDDLVTDPAGNSGARVACGVIQPE